MKTDKNFFITNTLSINSISTSGIPNIKNKKMINIIPTNKNIKNKEKELLNENFLDYLINNQTNYANFEKVIDYYEKKIFKNEKIFNENLKIIEKKKEEIQNLKKTINNNIFNNITLTNKNLDIYYLNLFQKIKNDIIFHEHQLEIYKKQYNDTYKLNYKLSNRLEKENKLVRIGDEQYNKYLNIKETSFSKMLKQEEMLKTLNNYFNKCQKTNEELRAQKKEKIKKLDYEVYLFKKGEQKYNQNIEEIKEKNNIINNIILEKQKQYEILYNDYKYNIKSYFRDKKYLNQIYEVFGIFDIENIIKIIKQLTQKYNELSLNFIFKSKENIKLNENLTNLNKEYIKLIDSIKNKKKAKNEDDKIINHIEKYDELKTKIQTYKNSFSEKYDNFQEKVELSSKFVSLILRLLDRIIDSSKNKDVFNIMKDINDRRFIQLKQYQEYYKIYIQKNNKINYDQVFFNKKFLIFIIFIFNELNYRIKTAISNVFNKFYKKELSEENNNKTSSEINIKNNKSVIDLNIENENKICICRFEPKKFENIINNKIKIIKEKLEEKKIFFKSKEKNMNENNNSKEKNNEYNLSSINRSMEYMSKKDFLYNYYLHYQKTITKSIPQDNSITIFKNKNNINNENTSSNFYNSSTKYNDSDNKINLNKFNFIINFTNDFVSDKKENEKKKKEKLERILKKSKKIKAQLEQEEFLKYLKKSRKKKSLLKHYYSQDDISIDSNELNESEMREELKRQFIHDELIKLKKEKKYNFKYESPEIAKIFKRNEDIKTLESNFYKNKKNFILDSSFFNENYFKLKKQFNENMIKANLRNKFLNYKKKMLSKTMINQSNINQKIKIKNNQNVKVNEIKNEYNINNNNKTFYINIKKINKKILNKSNSMQLINNSSLSYRYFNISKSNIFGMGINNNKNEKKYH